MKYILTFFSIFSFSFLTFSQQTINGSITHDNLEREYILYLPANYTGDTPVPLVFNFHGYTSNASQQMWYGDFRAIADTAGFILVHPEGTLLNGITHWNVGGWTIGSTADDVGFTNAMIDAFAADYNIDLDRVYATGMSNGGFMSFVLACQLSEKIAAVASVTGSMTPQTYDACNPQHPMPVLQIHGTDDSVVSYTGETWTNPVTDVVDYWVNYNNCNNTVTITAIPNTNIIDGSTVEHFVYDGGDNGANTEHFKITGGDHTWPGSAFPSFGTNYDINASVEIWKFFSRYDINGLIMSTSTDQLEEEKHLLKVYPNPTYSSIHIELPITKEVEYEVTSTLGELLLKGVLNSNNHELDLSYFPQGIYMLNIENVGYKILKL